MSNNLERHIAVVTPKERNPAHDPKLVAALGEFEFIPRYFDPSQLDEIVADDFDAILFDDVAIPLGKKIERILREFHREFKPIGVVGVSSQLVLNVFGYELELATEQNISADDFLSDRDFKVLSTEGSDVRGIRRMLRELWEMA